MTFIERWDKFLTILLILDVLLILGAVLFKWIDNYWQFILLFDTVLCIILIIQFVMKYRRAENKRLFFTSHWLDLFASLPIALLILPVLSSTLYAYNAIVLVRLLRILLLFKIFSKAVKKFLDATYLDKFIAIFIVIVLASTLILYFCDPNFGSLFDAIWFIFQTISTVGYGDIIPTSPIGQVIGLLLLIVGVLMFSIITASFAYLFNNTIFKDEDGEFNRKVDALKESMNETNSSIKEIKEKVNSNDEDLAEIKENMKELSQQMDNLMEIIEKR